MAPKSTYEELEQKIFDLEREIAECRTHDESLIDDLNTKYSSIFESVPASIVLLDKNGRIIDINPYHVKYVGYGKTVKEDYLNYNILEFPSVIAAGLQDEHKRVLNGESINLKNIYFPITTGGRDRFFNIRGVPLFKDNEVIGAVIIHEDISEVINSEKNLKKAHDELELRIEKRTVELQREIAERKRSEDALKKSEEKYRSMMEVMKDGVYINSPEFKIEYMNPSFIDRLGRDATGEICHKALYGLDEKCSWCVFDQVKQKKYVDYKITRPKDGHHYSISNSPIVNTDGTISKLAIFRDITKITTIENQLKQAQKMESVGRLAGGVAHDYNNALTTIMGFTELAMMESEPGGPLHMDLNEVLKAGRHAKDITRKLLAFARKETIAPKILDLNENVESMLKMLRHLIGEDIDLVWRPEKNLWSVKMDPSQIDQILANLCVNARDAIAGVGKIIIETDRVVLDEAYCTDHAGFIPGDFVLMAISDNGCGMDKEILDNIFEPFFTTKDRDKGTGLGLATVYGIVKQNNGFINVYSEQGIGTTIKIYLPRDDGTAIKVKDKSTDEIPQGRGETILLVEDNISILNLVQKILKELGYKVLAADTPKEAIRLAKEHKSEIHLIVTDVIMPEMNGLELANRLQTIYPSLKRMFMSGYTSDVIAQHGVLDAGVQFIQKPFSNRDLATIVRKVLDEEKS